MVKEPYTYSKIVCTKNKGMRKKSEFNKDTRIIKTLGKKLSKANNDKNTSTSWNVAVLLLLTYAGIYRQGNLGQSVFLTKFR